MYIYINVCVIFEATCWSQTRKNTNNFTAPGSINSCHIHEWYKQNNVYIMYSISFIHIYCIYIYIRVPLTSGAEATDLWHLDYINLFSQTMPNLPHLILWKELRTIYQHGVDSYEFSMVYHILVYILDNYTALHRCAHVYTWSYMHSSQYLTIFLNTVCALVAVGWRTPIWTAALVGF